MTTKDYISLGISLCALFVSGMVAFFNFFWTHHDVKVALPESDRVIDLVVAVEDLMGTKVLGVSTRQTFTFVNSGNAPVAITSIRLFAKQTKVAADTAVCEAKKNEYGVVVDGPNVLAAAVGGHSTFQPVVVDAKKIASTYVEIAKGAEIAIERGPNDTSIHVSVCYEFDVIVAHSDLRTIGVFVESQKVDLVERRSSGDPGPYRRGALFSLINESRMF